MKTSARAVRDGIQNVLDYLVDSELALNINAVAITSGRVDAAGDPYETIRFVTHDSSADFLISHNPAGIEQYLSWVRAGAYAAVLFDGSLLQISYYVAARGTVIGHRLAYVPCPYDIDIELFRTEAIADAIDLYVGSEMVLLRSPIRFDYAPEASKAGHPAAHLTINGPDCRIACVAPMHVLRFVDFVFRHAYPKQRRYHSPFFEPAAWQHIGQSVLEDRDRTSPHVTWDVHATMTSVRKTLAM